MRIEESKTKVTSDWTIDNLEEVLKTLKSNKARDAHGHVYEIFKFGGDYLKDSLLKMLNNIKRWTKYD